MKALLSIMALYNYDNTIFDNLQVPGDMDKSDVVNNILLELAELEVIYANPGMMRTAIGLWSKKELPVWSKLYDTTKFEYNPIWNQFRTEEWSDKETRDLHGSENETRDLTGSDKEVRNLSGTNNQTRNLTGSDNELRDLGGSTTHHSETEGTTANSGTDTQKEYVSAFNETTVTLAKQTEQTLGAGNTVTGKVDNTNTTTDTGTVKKDTTDAGTVNNSLTDTGTVDKTNTDKGNISRGKTDLGTVENSHTAKFEGHTGIVPVQKLIEMQRETVQFNVINYIINSFKKRFCIMVY